MLAACGEEHTLDQQILQSEQQIVRGQPAPDYPQIVAVRAFEPGSDRGALCSSTVIAPNIVLTAAHCLHPELVGANVEFFLQTAESLNDDQNPSPTVEVASVHYHPSFNPNNALGGFDIGVAITATPLDITPMPFNRTVLSRSLVGDPAEIVGYGLNNGFGQTGAGLRRKATVRLNSYNNQVVRTGSLFGATICNGDSGGPVLMDIDGVETVVGVHSYGTLGCFTAGSSTRVDQYLDFIDTYLN